ncbi:MAG: iron-sulfur cluster insertion protein ErpA [Candidatus Dadabacteria bacterium]|nr:iron-sulfur cluster insertion protein ErpA [Candidatus Dadabacteria bacterium]
MLSVTEIAAVEIKKLLAKENMPNGALRVRVVPGGCSGFSYEMGFDDVTEETDIVLESEGFNVVVDQMSAPYLNGSVLDYKDGLQGQGFSINNPNATATCGCGSSFTA